MSKIWRFANHEREEKGWAAASVPAGVGIGGGLCGLGDPWFLFLRLEILVDQRRRQIKICIRV
jgi:hypothetical protein